jgi:hypothetical protein
LDFCRLKLAFSEYLGALKLGDVPETCLYKVADFFFRLGNFGGVAVSH